MKIIFLLLVTIFLTACYPDQARMNALPNTPPPSKVITTAAYVPKDNTAAPKRISGLAIANEIRASMDSSDNVELSRILNTNLTFHSGSWVNPTTGIRYTIIPTTSLISMKGQEKCRKYRAIAVIKGVKRYIYTAACRQLDGSWLMA